MMNAFIGLSIRTTKNSTISHLLSCLLCLSTDIQHYHLRRENFFRQDFQYVKKFADSIESFSKTTTPYDKEIKTFIKEDINKSFLELLDECQENLFSKNKTFAMLLTNKIIKGLEKIFKKMLRLEVVAAFPSFLGFPEALHAGKCIQPDYSTSFVHSGGKFNLPFILPEEKINATRADLAGPQVIRYAESSLNRTFQAVGKKLELQQPLHLINSQKIKRSKATEVQDTGTEKESFGELECLIEALFRENVCGVTLSLLTYFHKYLSYMYKL